MTWIRGHWQLVLLAGAVALLWATPVFLPLRILVVFLHEFSHAFMAWITGGEVLSLTISHMEGGEVWARGGNRFLTLTAGYLGSLICGVVLFVLALKTDLDRWIVALFGGLILLIAALYVRDWFAIGFCIGAGAAFLLSARFLPHLANDVLLRVIGLASMIYAPWDIVSDTIMRSELRSDARMMAEEFGGATVIWGGLWLLVSAVVIVLTLRYGLGAETCLPVLRGMQLTVPCGTSKPGVQAEGSGNLPALRRRGRFQRPIPCLSTRRIG